MTREQQLEGALARAVAALKECRDRLEHELPPAPDHSCGGPNSACDSSCADFAYASEFLRHVDAILADADGTQAAEVWRELEAVYEAAKAYKTMHALTLSEARRWDNSATGQLLTDALAAVDARRGGGR
jgi:hypothetical protein